MSNSLWPQPRPNVGDKIVNIGSVEQNFNAGESATVNATGININLNLTGLSARDAFNRAVLDPLRSIYNSGFDEEITILMDALDESLSYEGGTTILNLLARLDSLPLKVRFIFTSRDDERVTNEFLEAYVLSLSSKENESLNQRDIADYVLWRLRND
jgi:hypothetical protein